MAGPVHSQKEIRDYIQNLWIRLGLFDVNEISLVEEAASNTNIHLHWVPDIQSMERSLRKDFYRKERNLFGDLNDEAVLKVYTEFAQDVSLINQKSLEAENQMLSAFYRFLHSFRQNPIMNLMRSSFRPLEVTEDGVYEKNRVKTDYDMDPNFSNELKFLRYGLRGKYGQDSLPMNTPVPKVGIEFRNDGTFVKTMKHADQVEGRLHQEVRDGERGIENDVERLRDLIHLYGIDSQFIDLAYKSFEAGSEYIKNSKWGKNSTIATFLLPLTPWEAHPLYQEGLKKLSPEQRAKTKEAMDLARYNYKNNVNALVQSFFAGSSQYSPSWMQAQNRNLFAETNRLGVNGITVKREELFQIILFGELMRFLQDSGVAEVMKN